MMMRRRRRKRILGLTLIEMNRLLCMWTWLYECLVYDMWMKLTNCM
jgi:hypothetical protein